MSNSIRTLISWESFSRTDLEVNGSAINDLMSKSKSKCFPSAFASFVKSPPAKTNLKNLWRNFLQIFFLACLVNVGSRAYFWTYNGNCLFFMIHFTLEIVLRTSLRLKRVYPIITNFANLSMQKVMLIKNVR